MKRILLILIFLPFFTRAQVINTIAGNGTPGDTGDGGPAVDAELYGPAKIFVDRPGNVYIAGEGNYVLRKINTAGIITTIAGNGTVGTTGDGGPATSAAFYGVWSVAVDDTGSIYILEAGVCSIRKVDTFGLVTLFAGNNGCNDTCDSPGDGRQATDAPLNIPNDIAVDHSGNLYIAEFECNRIRKVSASGIITTVAGNGIPGFMGDGGPATAAEISKPYSVAVDNDGNVYFGEQGNFRVRKITVAAGVITTVAGNGTGGYSGDGILATTAKIDVVTGLAVDSIGNVYIAEEINSRIRKIDTSGIISTVVGTGIQGFNGDGIPLASAQLHTPTDVKLDRSGKIFIADDGNNRIRSTMLPNAVKTLNNNIAGMHISPNPGSGHFSLQIATDIPEQALIIISDVLGRQVMQTTAMTNQVSTIQLDVPDGVYYISAQTSQNKYNQKIMIMH